MIVLGLSGTLNQTNSSSQHLEDMRHYRLLTFNLNRNKIYKRLSVPKLKQTNLNLDFISYFSIIGLPICYVV